MPMPPAPDHAHDGGGAHVGLEAVQRIGDPQRENLRDDAVYDFLKEGGPRGAHAFDRARLDGFHGLGEQLGEDARGVYPQSQHAREGAKAHGDHEQHGKHHFIDGTGGVHEAAHGW